ncbi:MAG: ParA family protein [Clostridia bacterium]|nr:ParA family protein [Clostridia bacterium]
MQAKRVTLFAGHYGSGKTNIAVNFALRLAGAGKPVTLADMDIVNPYYRSKDSAQELEAAGVKVIASAYANTNVDVPALPQEMYSVTEDTSRYAVLDVGGDDRGALALGRYAPAILKENDYHMIYVFNASRPLSRTAEMALEIMGEIEAAGGIPFTAIVNNTNLGRDTDWETVAASRQEAEKLSQISGLPLLFTAVEEGVLPINERENEQYFPLKLQKTIW